MLDASRDFMSVLSGQLNPNIPLYCTGYPNLNFMSKYLKQYNIHSTTTEFELNHFNYNLIYQMGFDAISLWNFRRGEGGYDLNNNMKVDGWARIKTKSNWYMWDGIFKNKDIIASWEHLRPPEKKSITELSRFLKKAKSRLAIILSLPGLFEKTWQSMGFVYFSKMLRKDLEFIRYVVSFFLEYLEKLISILIKAGVKNFLIADDCGYKGRLFIPSSQWDSLFNKPYTNIVEKIHENNCKVIIHSDGYITDLIPSFIHIGFDAIQGLEPSAGVDIFHVFKKFSDRISYIGNLDMSLLSFGSRNEVEVYVRKLITSSRKYHAPLIISPTQQIDETTKPENVKIMIDTTKKFKLKQGHL